MAPAKSSSSSAATPQNIRVVLAKNIASMTAKADVFAQAVETFNSYNEDTINAIVIEIDEKRKELEDLVKEYKTKERDEKIKLDQLLREHGYNSALTIIESNDKVAVNRETYEQLNADYNALKETFDKEIEKTKAIEKSKFEKELNNVKSNMELKFQADHAKVEACVSQKDNEIVLLKQTIENLREELASQRALTKDVAMAAKQGAIQQTFGKT